METGAKVVHKNVHKRKKASANIEAENSAKLRRKVRPIDQQILFDQRVRKLNDGEERPGNRVGNVRLRDVRVGGVQNLRRALAWTSLNARGVNVERGRTSARNVDDFHALVDSSVTRGTRVDCVLIS